MRHLLILIVTSVLFAGCSPAITASAPSTISPKNIPSGNVNIASIATEGVITEEAPTGENQSSSNGAIVTVNPTPIPLSPIQGNTVLPQSSPTPISTQGWKTFTSMTLGVLVDYPSGWSIAVTGDNVTFTSPEGMAVLLKMWPFNGNVPGLISQRCRTQVNPHNISAEICVETASSFSYSASFKILLSNGTAHELTLSTQSRQAAAIFEAMLESVRPAQ